MESEVTYEGKTETALFCASSLFSMSSYVEGLGALPHVKNNCYGYEKCIFSFNKTTTKSKYLILCTRMGLTFNELCSVSC